MQGSEKLSGLQDIGKTTNKATAYNYRGESQPVALKYSHGIGGRISVFNDISCTQTQLLDVIGNNKEPILFSQLRQQISACHYVHF